MHSQNEEITQLIREAFQGSEEAAELLLNRYGTFLHQAIRGTLSPEMRQAFDSLDFAQEVWASFFADERKADKCSTPGELRAYLRAMAKYKVVDAARREKSQKKDCRRNRPLQDAMQNLPSGTQPTPSQIVMGRETWEQLLAKQPAAYKKVLYLLRDGKDTNTIADELQVSARSVRRIIARLREKAASLGDMDQ
ncbi:MAG: RNA polymerase sigma factor [Gemmataceae bacterium]